MKNFMYIAHSDCANIKQVTSLPTWERDCSIMLNLFKSEAGGQIIKKTVNNIDYIYLKKDDVLYIPVLRKDIASNIAKALTASEKLEVKTFSIYKSKKLGYVSTDKELEKQPNKDKLIKVYPKVENPVYTYEEGFNKDCFLPGKDEHYQCPCCETMLKTLDSDYHRDLELRKIIPLSRYAKARKLLLINYNKDFADINNIKEFIKNADADKKADFTEKTGLDFKVIQKLVNDFENANAGTERLTYTTVPSKVKNTLKNVMSKEYKLLFDFETISIPAPIKFGQLADKDYMIECCVSVYDKENTLINEFKDVIEPDVSFKSNAVLLNDMFAFVAPYMASDSFIFVSYFKNFENNVLQSMNGFFRIEEYQKHMQFSYGKDSKGKDLHGSMIIKEIVANNFDLMDITKCSDVKVNSLKNIYKLLCEEQPDLPKYSDLAITDGLMATEMYKDRMWKKEKLLPEERQVLLDYCQLDCHSMMSILIDAYNKIVLGKDVD